MKYFFCIFFFVYKLSACQFGHFYYPCPEHGESTVFKSPVKKSKKKSVKSYLWGRTRNSIKQSSIKMENRLLNVERCLDSISMYFRGHDDDVEIMCRAAIYEIQKCRHTIGLKQSLYKDEKAYQQFLKTMNIKDPVEKRLKKVEKK